MDIQGTEAEGYVLGTGRQADRHTPAEDLEGAADHIAVARKVAAAGHTAVAGHMEVVDHKVAAGLDILHHFGREAVAAAVFANPLRPFGHTRRSQYCLTFQVTLWILTDLSMLPRRSLVYQSSRVRVIVGFSRLNSRDSISKSTACQ